MGRRVAAPDVEVVVPTVGRPSLARLLEALGEGEPGRIVVVDDRRGRAEPLDLGRPGAGVADRLRVLPGPAVGPAAARNVGWRAGTAEWVVFLDDDVVPAEDWWERLVGDLAGLGPDVGGSQGRLRVPLPVDRPPTDRERSVRGLEGAAWITADMAYRRSALEAVGGFDERFPRAYREDADLALRVRRAGYRLVRGDRLVLHPAADAGPWASVRAQAGNADDALMLVLHGPGWRRTAETPRGRRPAHLLTTAAGLMAVAGAARGRRGLAATGALAWIGATGELAWRRVGPGPRTGREVARMLATTPLIPPAATLHWLVGLGRALALRRAGPWGARDGRGGPGGRPLEAVLLDRDGTLVADVAYNGDPSRVRPMPGARRALDRLRRAGLRLAVVSNQSGIARGLLTPSGVEAVNRRVEDLLGPFDGWFYCPHGPADGCPCRKPAPGLVLAAARALGVRPERCAVVGDTAADVGAARAVGARAILVPTPATRGEEARAAPELAADLEAAADRLVGPAVPG